MANDWRQYIQKQIHESEKNPKKLWATVDNIMHKKAMPSMPDSTDLSSLCFQQKLKKIDWNSALITVKPNVFHLLK